MHQAFQLGTSNPVSVTSSHGGVIRNIAESLARLECDVSLFSIVGEDAEGVDILRALDALNVDVSGVKRSSHQPTASYTAILEGCGHSTAGLANMDIFEELDSPWVDRIAPMLESCGILIVDGNLPAETLETLLSRCRKDTKVLADPVSAAKSLRFLKVLGQIDVIFPDRLEATALCGKAIETNRDLGAAAAEIRKLGAGSVVVTLGAAGLYVDCGQSREFISAMSTKKVLDVTGAGDALVAGFAYGLIKGEAVDPLKAGLATASLALESRQSVPPDLTPGSLHERIASSNAL